MLYAAKVSKTADSVWWRPGLSNVQGNDLGRGNSFKADEVLF